MKLRRLRVASLAADELTLASASAHYVRDVLRLTSGAEVELFDGTGGAARARLTIDATTVSARVLERHRSARTAEVTIAMAVPKGDRADWAVEKLTEIGVTRIAWLVCTRSVVVPREDGKRMARFERIAESAAAQSGRNDVPEVLAPLAFAESLEVLGGGVIAHPDGEPIAKKLAAQSGRPLTCLIGPEGGFTPEELAMADAAGYSRVCLTQTILRTETAAVAAAVAMESVSREREHVER